MTDFTKEELGSILKFIDAAENSCGFNFCNDLTNKIIDEINNYCEHDNSKRIDGFVRDKTDYTNCNHQWDNVECATPIVTPTMICINAKQFTS
jgi:hypothetical protein